MGAPPPAKPRVVRFGAFELDLRAGELRKNGAKIRLQDQPFQVLALLWENRGHVVTREELRQKLWPGNTFVDFDNGLNTCINKIREALGDSAESPRFVETLPRRGYRFIGVQPTAPNDTSGRIQSLVVLPLENISRDPEQEYFADGLTEALITNLAKISALRVVSRTTAMQYKGARKTLPEIARELSVDAVVEGTVQRFGGRARVSAQLVQASTDTHLWAESYERDLRDMMALQSELARAIASEIQVKLTPQEQMQLARVRQVDPEAYDCYLKGRYHWNKRYLEGLTKGAEYFQKAIDRDPTYAAAYAGLADSASRLGFWTDALPQEGCARGKTAALRAIEMDGSLSEAHAALWFATLHYDFDIRSAEGAAERAIELDPRNPIGLQGRACCLVARGRAEEAAEAALQAIKVEPLNMAIQWTAGIFHYFARRYDEAIALSRRTLELDPKFAPSHWTLGLAYAQKRMDGEAVREMEEAVRISQRSPFYLGVLGYIFGAVEKKAAAQRVLAELDELSKQRHVSPYWRGMIYSALSERDEAIRWLERALEARAPWMAYLKAPPWFDNLRADSRYYSLLQRMNIPI